MNKKLKLEAFSHAVLESVRDISAMENLSPYDYINHLHKEIHKVVAHRHSHPLRKARKDTFLCILSGALFAIFMIILILRFAFIF